MCIRDRFKRGRLTYQEAEQVGLKRQRSKQAIALAMEGRWREAVAINKEIIESFPNDVEAYNRLGKAYMELGEYAQAMEAYKRVIEIDPYNTIAKKNLVRLSHLMEARVDSEGGSFGIEPRQFIEEAGKAGVVSLYRLAPKEVLARVVAGARVQLRIDGQNLIVEDSHGQYLGQVVPKHAKRLIRLMQGGNEYTAAITSSTEDAVTIIIREVYQHPSQAGQLSFPPKTVEELPPEITHRIPRREVEYEEESIGGPGYTIVGGEETEELAEESPEDDTGNSEE